MASTACPLDTGLLLTADELTGATVASAQAGLKWSSEMATDAMREAAIREGPRATRRHNLAVACSILGSQAEMARRLIEHFGGGDFEVKKKDICRILGGVRDVSEDMALAIEAVMGWGYYEATTVWIERRATPTQVYPKHVLERRHNKL